MNLNFTTQHFVELNDNSSEIYDFYKMLMSAVDLTHGSKRQITTGELKIIVDKM